MPPVHVSPAFGPLCLVPALVPLVLAALCNVGASAGRPKRTILQRTLPASLDCSAMPCPALLFSALRWGLTRPKTTTGRKDKKLADWLMSRQTQTRHRQIEDTVVIAAAAAAAVVSSGGPPDCDVLGSARSKMAGGRWTAGGPQASAFSLILLVDDQGPFPGLQTWWSRAAAPGCS